ncbi:hypothetical protein [Bacillus xiapuensis]|uniref:hypothetical protein n=1 Tax=Bacillus xiapuensis TaxID=2014075 RepID=UPI0012FD4213|nr:hypothetical protein [Bacillus xiapuensis]
MIHASLHLIGWITEGAITVDTSTHGNYKVLEERSESLSSIGDALEQVYAVSPGPLENG